MNPGELDENHEELRRNAKETITCVAMLEANIKKTYNCGKTMENCCSTVERMRILVQRRHRSKGLVLIRTLSSAI